MIIQSKYTKIFHSKGLTRQKYDELHDFAVLIQNHKNTVSQYVNDNLLHLNVLSADIRIMQTLMQQKI